MKARDIGVESDVEENKSDDEFSHILKTKPKKSSIFTSAIGQEEEKQNTIPTQGR